MIYTVSEMAKRLGLSPSTLRYYDKEGLLPFVARSDGGNRMFTDKDYEWLNVIECLKRSGLTIKEIRDFTGMILRGDQSSLAQRLALFRARRDAVKKQMAEMRDTLALLEFKCWYYEQALQDGTEERVRALPSDEIPEQHRAIREKIRTVRDKIPSAAVTGSASPAAAGTIPSDI